MGLGLPYMGNKRKLAKEILDVIQSQNPNAKYFYDLFGGGGAISFEALKRNLKVVYNEIDTGVVNLLRKIQQDGMDVSFYDWVSREDFYKYRYGTCWKSGLVKICWSFGNNGKDYIYGEDIEDIKKQGHDYCLYNKKIEGFENLPDSFDLLSGGGFNLNLIHSRRLFLNSQSRVGGLESLIRLEHLLSLSKLQRLERIELELGRLELSNLSYEEVEITTPIEETIIYCDPPYENTQKYQNDIDHKKFYDWVKNHKYKIYISSYEATFEKVASWKHRSTLSATANNGVIENLYCNKP